ncbi:MarR family winged helix-turn-helix transcriptional regulator (plasmid) [Klebsiella sp. B345]|uniref:MarR family winged helix-turn-helix transcriptional regulator n=1 Tax=Klebsiella sp. B345 TaxID=2755398 RepID=UPI003DA98BF0
MDDKKMPPRTYMTLRLDALNSMAKQLGSRSHEQALGLSLRDVRLLLLIHEQPGLTVSELVDMSFLERTMVSKGITQLSQLGLVDRNIITADARQIGLTLTIKGQDTARKASDIALEGIGGMLSVLTPHERDVFEVALEKMTAKVRADLEEMRQEEANQIPGEKRVRR